MNEIAIVDNWKDYFNKTIYNIVYGRKFKKAKIQKKKKSLGLLKKAKIKKNFQIILEII